MMHTPAHKQTRDLTIGDYVARAINEETQHGAPIKPLEAPVVSVANTLYPELTLVPMEDRELELALVPQAQTPDHDGDWFTPKRSERVLADPNFCEQQRPAREAARSPTPVGDLNSTARGTGARMNGGKLPVELIPVRAHWLYWNSRITEPSAAEKRALDCLLHLAVWQETQNIGSLEDAMLSLDEPMRDAALVFDYGRRKYAAWNWAKGMQWSVALACAIRHLTAILKGTPNDDESFLPHEGHVACNIVMLQTFVRSYPEGNDMCPVEYLKARR
jgi:hypothetical protein